MPQKEILNIKLNHITTKGPPIADRTRYLSLGRYKFAKEEIRTWIEQGDCNPSNSQWASPIYLQQQKNGGWRICGDYRRLNKVTIPDKSDPTYTRLCTQTT